MTVPFTADVCARAIIGACASYGDDPVKAMQAKGGHRRSGLVPAAAAVRIATGATHNVVAKAIGIGRNSVVAAESGAKPHYLKAKTAALYAIGGAAAVLAPEPGKPPRPARPEPDTVSGLPDALLSPRPIAPPIQMEIVSVQTVAPPLAIAAPNPRAHRTAQIRDLLDQGWSNRAIAAELGVTIGVVAGQRQRLRTEPAKAAPKAVAPERGLVAGRAAPPTRFERLELRRDDRAPQPTRDKIAPSDQALIAEALAKGKVTQLPPAVADGGHAHGVSVPSQPTTLGFDPATRKYSRVPGATRAKGFA